MAKIKFALGAIAVLLVIAILLFCIFGVRSCAMCREVVKEAKANVRVSIRYSTSPDLNSGEVVVVYVDKGKDFVLTSIPEKEGYMFLGLYNGENFAEAEMYVDSNGYSLMPVTEDMTLFPYFIKRVG
ncbi:MAG: hypothetical protein E7637_02900 [Ruminococcaceae bacterium]|nr:hypothetical protein [Oscillospiraceae bacterium]